MEKSILRIITVYLVGITGIWKAIPVGMILKSHPLEIAILTSLGSITTVYVLYFFGSYVKNWVLKKWSADKLEKKKGKFTTIMDRYGIIGIGVICPGIFGPITCIIVGLFVVKNTSKLMPYLAIGIIIWSFALTYAATSGLDILSNWFT